MKTEIIYTEDGSHTLRAIEMDECFHSIHGAVCESMHIFIGCGLYAFTQQSSGDETNVLEIGFGTGLNAYLTLCEAETSKRPIRYTSLELYPPATDDVLRLNYPEILQADRLWFEKIHLAPWNAAETLTSCFTLCKVRADFTQYNLQGRYDVIFFDAFSPQKQPELWTQDGFRKIYAHSSPGAVLTTYCAKGSVRRALRSAGFTVERLPGPPGGKREILRARCCPCAPLSPQ